MRMGGMRFVAALVLILAFLCGSTLAQCPWRKTVPELNNMCVCVVDEETKLSVQCTDVNFPLLMTTLHKVARNRKMDLLYVNSSDIGLLNSRIFDGLHIENIQFSHSRIYNISDQAFVGLKNSLKNLNLESNRLTKVPSLALSELPNLELLDLSSNLITSIPDGTFSGLNLVTLKIGGNELKLSQNSFAGLEQSLKNLNLKGSALKHLPQSIQKMTNLAFLDLAQNEIKKLLPGSLRSLNSLAALNLERNLLQEVSALSFIGVNDSLSSLSLLNNMIREYPLEAVNSLPKLRVLDIGFNLLETLPLNAFHNVKSLTLLALDGNQLSSIPEEAFGVISRSLKGLSVGGKFLNCNCKIAWVLDWIKNRKLQVTSRERNPQFCGKPAFLRDRSLYQLSPEELPCRANSTTSNTRDEPIPIVPLNTVTKGTAEPVTLHEVATESSRNPSFIPVRRGGVDVTEKPLDTFYPDQSQSSSDNNRQDSTFTQSQDLLSSQSGKPLRRAGFGGTDRKDSTPSNEITDIRSQLVRHSNILDEKEQFNSHSTHVDEVIVQKAYRRASAVIIQWDSEVSNILGFRVVYRLFGDKKFKLGPPLASSEREFKIKNVPSQECVVVCVVSLEDTNITPKNVPYDQCREIRTEDSASTHMDIIVIGSTAAICGTVVLALAIFICCNRRKRTSSRRSDMMPNVITQSAAPLASLGTLGGGVKGDWDTLSMYSQRSIPRARMYHMDKGGNVNGGFIPDDLQSHISAASFRPQSRAMADLAPLSMSRPDLRMSRQSLAGNQLMGYNGMAGAGMMSLNGMGGMGHMNGMNGFSGLNTLNSMNNRMSSHGGQFSRAASTRSRNARSKSRERASSRVSHAGSSHSLTGYDDSEGWTDHDMDIYMARNPTRGGLVQL